MHICQIMSSPFPPEEGIGNYVNGLSNFFLENGHKVTVFTRGKLFTTIVKQIDNLTVIEVPFIPLYPVYMGLHKMFLTKEFTKIKKNFDIIHFHSPLVPPIKTSQPNIVTFHSAMLIDAKFRGPNNNIRSICEKIMSKYISYPIEKNLISQTELITTVSTTIAKELEMYPIGATKIRVIGNGVDEKVFFPLNRKCSKPYILCVGRLDYAKGMFDLIQCAKLVCNKNDEVIFIIAGKGPACKKLQYEVKLLGIEHKVKFLGHCNREKIVGLNQNSTVTLIPSHHEGLPTTLLEAMACGSPVIATRISGNTDVIESEVNGILIPPKSPKIMAETIVNLLTNDQHRWELGKNARKTIEEKYTWDIISNEYLKCYNSVITN